MSTILPLKNLLLPEDNLYIRKGIYSVFEPLSTNPRITIECSEDYKFIGLYHKHAHVPDFTFEWADYGGGNYLYRVYIWPYNPTENGKMKVSYSIATIRSIAVAYGFVSTPIFLDKNRANNRG